MSFLHGVETIETQVGPVPVNTVKTAVIGIVGTSPKGEPGKVHLIQREEDFENFLGHGGTLGDAMNAIWDHCHPTIMAINVFDMAQHFQLVDQTCNLTKDGVAFADCGIPAEAFGFVVRPESGAPFVLGTDYILDNDGLKQLNSGALSLCTSDVSLPTSNPTAMINEAPETMTVTGKKANGEFVPLIKDTDYTINNITIPVPSITITLTASGISKIDEVQVSTVPVVTGYLLRTEWTEPIIISYKVPDMTQVSISCATDAFSSFESALSAFGFFPKILIAPGFSQELAVGREMVAVAEKIRAMAYIDAPEGLNPTEAVQFKSTNYGDARAMFCYPKANIWDNAQGVYRFDWLSSRLAGLRAKTDFDEGYWYSISNHIIQGITGMERVLDYNPSETSSELNYVNSMGVISVLNFLGSGYRSFGNRTCAFPFQTDPLNTFECWRRVGDIIEESITYFTMQFLDKPMFSRPENAKSELILRVEESVNDFMRELKGRGALVEGFCVIKADENPVSNLANGQLAYHYEFTPAVPAERITYNAVANITALETVFAEIATA